MKNLLFALPFFVILLLSQNVFAHIAPFTTDGCSRFIDGPLTGKGNEWVHCCEEHDVRYWAGIGGKKGQNEADLELRRCIVDAGFPGYASTMYTAVLAARPVNAHTYVPYRWGYGWKKLIHHRQLTNEELVLVKQMTATIVTGIATYHNAKGYPAPTVEQQISMGKIIDEILTTEAPLD